MATDRPLIRAGARSKRYVTISFTAPEAPRRAERTPVNVALVLDRSGSMSGDKITLARQAAERSLAMLRAEDRFALVVYDDRVDVVAENTPATPEAKRRALQVLREVQPRGSTNLGGGWLTGCEQVALHAGDSTVNRCLLLTDGLANQGITDGAQLARHATELRARGVSTSTFGVGADFDERLLGGMADAGGGHAYYIDAPHRIPELITSELGEALEVVLREAALDITLPPYAHGEVLNTFRRTRRGGAETGDESLQVELGYVVSSQDVTVAVMIEFPRGHEGDITRARFALAGRDRPYAAAPAEISWTWASHEANDAQPRNRAVDRVVASLYAARARAEATELNRAGDYTSAGHALHAVARHIGSYAGNDAELADMARALMAEEQDFAAPMAAPMLKVQYYRAMSASRARDESGRAKRKDP